jgi:hypothetical protein
MMRYGNGSLSGEKIIPTVLTMATEIAERLEYERRGPYKALYDELDRLDKESPHVTRNHAKFDEGSRPMEYAIANLLYSAHKAGAYPTETPQTRKDALDVLEFLTPVPGGKAMLMALVHDLFPQAVICTEHLYFLQREVSRLLSLSNNERPEQLRDAVESEWMFPQERVDALRTQAIELWKTDEDNYHADEDRK